MIGIRNTGATEGGDPNDHDGERRYEIRINYNIIAKFTHKRSDGLAVCLDKAAAAVRARDG